MIYSMYNMKLVMETQTRAHNMINVFIMTGISKKG